MMKFQAFAIPIIRWIEAVLTIEYLLTYHFNNVRLLDNLSCCPLIYVKYWFYGSQSITIVTIQFNWHV